MRGKLRSMIDFVGYGKRLAAVVDECVGVGGLVGVYVHGSAVLGGFRPDRSDVDALVVVATPVPADRQAALGAALLAAAYPCPGIGLELSVITAATATNLGDCGFEVHVGTPDEVVIGAGHPGDDDLILNAEVCRRSGLAAVGPTPSSVFGAVPRPRLVTAMLAELEWSVSSAPFEYAVLNAAARCASRPTATCGRRSPAASGISPAIRTTRSFARRWPGSAAATRPSRRRTMSARSSTSHELGSVGRRARAGDT